MSNTYALVKDPMVLGNTISLLDNKDNDTTGKCFNCQKELQFETATLMKRKLSLIDVCCSYKCAKESGWYEKVITPEYIPDIVLKQRAKEKKLMENVNAETSEPVQAPKKEAKGPCLSCGGPAKGRGYTHSDGCSAVPIKEPKITCLKCGGKRRRGRGLHFDHVAGCDGTAIN